MKFGRSERGGECLDWDVLSVVLFLRGRRRSLRWIFACCVTLRLPNQCFLTLPSNYNKFHRKGTSLPEARAGVLVATVTTTRQAETGSGKSV